MVTSVRSVRAGMAVAVILVAAFFAAFTSIDNSNAAAKKKQFTIGYVPPTVAPFEVAWRKGIQLQAKKYGMKVVIAGGQLDPKVQIAAVKTLLTRGIDALAIIPLDEKSIKPVLDEVKSRHIPIVVYDAAKTTYDVNLKANDFQATQVLAKYAAKKAGKPCKVGVMQGFQVVPILKRRADGYKKGAVDAGCEILDVQTDQDDTTQKATEIAQAWRTRFGKDMNVVLANNDPYALSVAAQSTGSFHPVIVGMNGDANAITAIKQGRLAASAALLSPELGNAQVYAAWQLLHHKKVPRTINAPYKIITKANVNTYKSYAERLRAPMTVSFKGGHLTTKLGR